MMEKYKSHKIYYQSTIMLAGPVVVSQLGHTVVLAVDSIIIGHYAGTISLAAVSLVHSVFMVVLVLGMGIACGLTPLIAQEHGNSNHKECAKLLSNSLWVNTIAAILLFLMTYYGSMFAMSHLDQDPRVVETAKPYLLLLGISIFPLMMFQAFKQFAEGLGFTKKALRISIWGNVINLILAVILVRGVFGFSPIGIKGIGVAALIGRVLMMVVMGWYVLKSRNFKAYIPYFSIQFFDFSRIGKVVRIGVPVASQYIFEIGAFVVAALLAGKIGAMEQAAHQTAITFVAMIYMMTSGISSAATIKVGNSFGKQNYFRIHKFTKVSYALVIFFMSIFAVIFMLFSQYLPDLITDDKAVTALAAKLLVIAGVFQLFDGTQVFGLGKLRGMGDLKIPTFITFFAYWVVGLPTAYVLGITLNIGVQGIWYGLTLGLLTSCVLLYARSQYMINHQLKTQ